MFTRFDKIQVIRNSTRPYLQISKKTPGSGPFYPDRSGARVVLT